MYTCTLLSAQVRAADVLAERVTDFRGSGAEHAATLPIALLNYSGGSESELSTLIAQGCHVMVNGGFSFLSAFFQSAPFLFAPCMHAHSCFVLVLYSRPRSAVHHLGLVSCGTACCASGPALLHQAYLSTR